MTFDEIGCVEWNSRRGSGDQLPLGDEPVAHWLCGRQRHQASDTAAKIVDLDGQPDLRLPHPGAGILPQLLTIPDQSRPGTIVLDRYLVLRDFTPPSTRCSIRSAPRATPPVAAKPAATSRAPAVMVIAC
jgi:hypothetical protein